LGDREALNIKELEANKITTALITTIFDKNPPFFFVLSGLENFLAQEHSGLFGKNL
jgi:hypothetical protein